MLGGKVWWVVPDYTTIVELWDEIVTLCGGIARKIKTQQRRLWFPGGGTLTLKSAHNPRKLVGVGLDGLVMDECGIIDPVTWRESLRPTLADRGGWAIFGGTPKGFNWFHDLYETAGTEDGWGRWKISSQANTTIQLEEWESARREMGPAKYAQEIEAQFTQVEGAEFPAEWLTDDILTDYWPERCDLVTMAVDPSTGKAIGDYSAIVCLAVENGVLYVDAIVERLASPILVRKSVAAAAKWRPIVWGFEANGFQEVIVKDINETIFGEGIGIPHPIPIKNTVNKVARIQRLGGYLERGAVRIKRSAGSLMLLSQLREFPVSSNDDAPDALEMAVRLAEGIKAGGRGDEPMKLVA